MIRLSTILRRNSILAGLLCTHLLMAAEGAPSVAVSARVIPIQERETPAQRDDRMRWWREARFGMFIHWGLYAEPAGIWKGKSYPGIGEWIMDWAKIPVADYKGLAKTFNPRAFDAEQWVSIAQAAGVRYIVITAKHHDGFAMFRSEADPFNIYDATPFKRDPLKELAAACAKHGIRLGFYYSQNQDWTAPGGIAMDGHWDPKAQDGNYVAYLEGKVIPQLQELLTNYGSSPSVIWFDTPTADMSPVLAGKIVALLNNHPGVIWNNRLGGKYKGDTETPEQRIPPRGYPGEDWETCMTINDTWGYKTTDINFKSTDLLLRNLIDIASKGGNYLLNVGPDATGRIPGVEVDRLRDIGQWLKVNGEAIYGCGPTRFGAEAGTGDPALKDAKSGKPIFHPTWLWRCTTKPGRVYVHLLQWPGAIFAVPALEEKVHRAYLLADPHHDLAFTQDASGIVVTLPTHPAGQLPTVIVLATN